MFFGFDINVLLLILVIVTGVVWGAHLLLAGAKAKVVAKQKPPWWLDYSRSFFPILLAVFVFRAFLFEPYQIPSGSMLPSLRSGDFILVNKYTYGLHLPVNNLQLTKGATPKRGEVVVFDFPPDPRVRYIKRLIGLPGDKILYRNKTLTINDAEITYETNGEDADIFWEYLRDSEGSGARKGEGETEREAHAIRLDPLLPSGEGQWTVPPGHYFVMGDNRDNSNDSRYWGFVPRKNMVGKAVYIWMHWKSWKELPGFERNKRIR